MQSTPQNPEAGLAEKLVPLNGDDGLKMFMRVDWDHEDGLLKRYRSTAIRLCEEWARISILPKAMHVIAKLPKVEADYDFHLFTRVKDKDGINKGIRLRSPPVLSVESVKMRSFSGTMVKTLVLGTDYVVDPDIKQIRWMPNMVPWHPDGDENEEGWSEVAVNYTAGFAIADTLDEQTEAVKSLGLAVMEVVAYMYENRGMVGQPLPSNAVQILRGFWNSPLMKRYKDTKQNRSDSMTWGYGVDNWSSLY